MIGMKWRAALVLGWCVWTAVPPAWSQEAVQEKQPEPVEFLIEALWHGESRIRQNAVRRLSEMAEKPYEPMTRLLAEGTQFQAATAAIVIGNLKEENEPVPEAALKALYGILSDPATEVWRWNITATLLAGVPSNRQVAEEAAPEDMKPNLLRETGIAEASLKDHVELWIWGVNHPSPLVQLPSLRALQKTGERGKPAQSAVVDLLKRPRGALTSYVLKDEIVTDGKIGLEQPLPDYDPLVILETLAAIQADPRVMVEPLMRLSAHPVEYIRLDAAAMLGKIDAAKLTSDPRPHAVRVLADLAMLPFGKVRVEAARELGKIGEPAAVAVPALVQLLEDRDGDVRLQAARSLGELGAVAKEALPALRTALRFAKLDTQAAVDALEAAIQNIEMAVRDEMI